MSVECRITNPVSPGSTAAWVGNYTVRAAVTYRPDPDPVGCDEVAILQVEKATTTGGVSFHTSAHAEQESRQTPDFHSVDRGLTAANTPFFGAQQDSSGELVMDAAKAKAWKRSEGLSGTAYLVDEPGAQKTWRAEFQSCAVCRRGARRGAVLECAHWGFDAIETTVPNRQYTLTSANYRDVGVLASRATKLPRNWPTLEAMRSELLSLNFSEQNVASLVNAAQQVDLPTTPSGTIALLPSGVSTTPNEGFRRAVERWNAADWTKREIERIALLPPPTTGTTGTATVASGPVVLRNGTRRKVYNGSAHDLWSAVREITEDRGLLDEAPLVEDAFRAGLPFGSRAEMIEALSAELPPGRSQVAERIAEYVLENCS